MKKRNRVHHEDEDLEIPPLGPEFFKDAEMGRYYGKMMANSNVVRIARDLVAEFPNEAAVNQALRELLKFRETLSNITASGSRKKKSA